MAALTMELKDLSALGRQLNSLTDDLNKQLTDIQERLEKSSIGVEAWVKKDALHEEYSDTWTGDPFPTRHRIATELGYARLGDGWELAVRTVIYLQELDPNTHEWCEYGGEVKRAKPLLRATRTLRAAAVDRIPALIDALYEAGSKLVDAVEKARKISSSLK
jgi:hypothetical protein